MYCTPKMFKMALISTIPMCRLSYSSKRQVMFSGSQTSNELNKAFNPSLSDPED